MSQLSQPMILQKISLWYLMIVCQLCWHRPLLMKNIRQKSYPQFFTVHDFGDLDEEWPMYCVWPIAERLWIWVIGWHVFIGWTLTWAIDDIQSYSVLILSYPCDRWYVCSTLRELAVSNQSCLSIMWSKCCNTCQDLWIMTITLWWSWRCVLCLIIIIKSEVWIINHCLGLGHETAVLAICRSS